MTSTAMPMPVASSYDVPASPVIVPSLMFSVPVSPSTYSSAPCQVNRPARVTTNDGTPKPENNMPWTMPMVAPASTPAPMAR